MPISEEEVHRGITPFNFEGIGNLRLITLYLG